MTNWNVYVWTEATCGYADYSLNVDADDHEGALHTTMDQLDLEEAHTAQIFECVDGGPEDHATHFDNVTNDGAGCRFEKKWRW